MNELSTTVNSTNLVSYFPTESDWNMMLDVGKKAFNSGLVPTGVRTPEAAAIIALKGRELGIPIMMAFSHIYIVNGRPTISAELMQGLARKNLPGLVINLLESTDKVARVELIRPERGSKPFVSMFAIADAERAKLLSKDVWKYYPTAMLWARAISSGLRKVCPEALMGISYTPEEFGAKVDQDGNPLTNENGVILETTGRPVSESEAAKLGNLEPPVKKPLPGTFTAHTGGAGSYRMTFGRFKGRLLQETGMDVLTVYYNEVKATCEGKTNLSKPVEEFLRLCGEYLNPTKPDEELSEKTSEVFEAALAATPDPRDGIK